MYWLAFVRVVMWAPLAALAALGSTVTVGWWSAVLAVAAGLLALLFVINLLAVKLGADFMAFLQQINPDSTSDRTPGPIGWWYRRRGR